MSKLPPSDSALRVADLSQNTPVTFLMRPEPARLAEIAEALGLTALRKLSFEGHLRAVGKTDWRLTGRLGATVVQPCVVTLEPVTTRIDKDIERQFIADYADPEDPEVEMPQDETSEALGAWIDPDAVMQEALALALPDYPRKDGAELGQMVYTKPGDVPMTDEDARPFAGLADLKARLDKSSD